MSNNLDPRWGPTFCGASSGSKLFAKVIIGMKTSPLAGKELKETAELLKAALKQITCNFNQLDRPFYCWLLLARIFIKVFINSVACYLKLINSFSCKNDVTSTSILFYFLHTAWSERQNTVVRSQMRTPVLWGLNWFLTVCKLSWTLPLAVLKLTQLHQKLSSSDLCSIYWVLQIV